MILVRAQGVNRSNLLTEETLAHDAYEDMQWLEKEETTYGNGKQRK